MAVQTQDQDQDTRQDTPDPVMARLLASGESLRERQAKTEQDIDTALEAKQSLSEKQAKDIEARLSNGDATGLDGSTAGLLARLRA